jgi:6-phospho-beta-glucosidase
MEKLCPQAWLINFTNPASMVTGSILNYSSIKCIGVCNVPILYEKLIMKHLNCQH